MNIFLLLNLAYQVACLGVMSIDMGSEWFKVAIVKPGVPMEIALNKESKRKTAVAVHFRNGERLVGGDAADAGNKYPMNTYKYFTLLLGKSMDDPAVADYKAKFPYHTLVATERNTVAFETLDGAVYSVESMMAQVLSLARQIASTYAETPIADAVICVPSTWGQTERLSMRVAAELAGIKLHQLMNDNTAVALHYAVFHRKEIESKPLNIMFFDMGASSTTATIVQYQKVKGKIENAPQVSVKGVGNAPVGGLKIDLTLRDLLVDKWEATKKTSTDIKKQKTGRALAKLLVSANKVKKVLSANKDTRAQVENLIDEEDFKAPVSRDEMESRIEDDIAGAMGAVRDALKTSGMSVDELKKVIMFGGGQRVPAVQEALRKELGDKLELSFSINSDEAAALGGSYQGAYVTKFFRVQTIWVKDAALEPITVHFERQVDPEENDGKSIKEVKRALFQVMNPYPQKKAVTFNRFADDFNFTLHIGDQLASSTQLKGVKEAMEEYSDAESKGVKAHFRMDESGVIRLESAEATFQREVIEEVKEEEKKDAPDFDKGTLDALKDKFKDFFNGDGDNEEEARKVLEELAKAKKEEEAAPDSVEEEGGETEEEKQEETGEEAATEAEAEDGEEKMEDSEEEKTKEEATEGAEAKDEDKDDKTEEKKEPPKPVLKTFSKKLEFDQEHHLVQVISQEEKDAVYEQLKKLDELEAAKVLLEESQNALESLIYDMQEKIDLEGWMELLCDEEKDTLRVTFSEASDWLWDVEEPTAVDYQDKLAELKKSTKSWLKRVEEANKRPEAIERLLKLIAKSKTIIFEDFKNQTGEGLALTQEDIHGASEKIEKVEDWLKEEEAAQSELKSCDMPSLKVSDIEIKERVLFKDVDSLIKKVRMWRPPKEKTEKKEKKKKKDKKTTEGSGETVEINADEEDEPKVEKTEEEKPATEAPPETTEEPVTHDSAEL